MEQLEDLLRSLQVLETVGTHVAQAGTVRHRVLHELSRCLREHDLASVRDRPQASAAVDSGSVVVVVAQLGLTGVQGHAHVDGNAFGPCLALEKLLRSKSRDHGIRGAEEQGEDAVSCSSWSHDGAAIYLNGGRY